MVHEATSALDGITENVVMDAVNNGPAEMMLKCRSVADEQRLRAAGHLKRPECHFQGRRADSLIPRRALESSAIGEGDDARAGLIGNLAPLSAR